MLGPCKVRQGLVLVPYHSCIFSQLPSLDALAFHPPISPGLINYTWPSFPAAGQDLPAPAPCTNPYTTSEVGLLSVVAQITLVLTVIHLQLLPNSSQQTPSTHVPAFPAPLPLPSTSPHPHIPSVPVDTHICGVMRMQWAAGSAVWSVHTDWVTVVPSKQLDFCWSYLSIRWSMSELFWPSSCKISSPSWVIWLSSTRGQAGLEVTPPPPPRTERSMFWDTLHLHQAGGERLKPATVFTENKP